MNNHKNIWRICIGPGYGIGPYGYFIHKIWEREKRSEDEIIELLSLLSKKERWADTKISKTYKDRFKRIPAYEEYGAFSTFLHRRPGVWDDPVLKDNIRKRFGSRRELTRLGDEGRVSKTYFGFDSERQLYEWFNDEKELDLIFKLGFRIEKFRENMRNVIFGLRQVWVVECKTYREQRD